MIKVKAMSGEMSLNYPRGPNLITGTLKRGGPFPAVVRECEMRKEEGSERCEVADVELEGP